MHTMTDRAAAPLVSVLLPVHNGERYIDDAISSILSQSMGDFELIVVDDHSLDRTAERLAAFANADPRVIVLQPPRAGLVAALEAGRKLARGRYIARMDADDISAPDRLHRQISALESNPRLVALGGQIAIIDENGAFVRAGRFPIPAADCRAHLALAAPFCHPAVTIRRAALDQCGGYRDAYAPAEDYDLWLRLSRLGDLANLPAQVLSYRTHPAAVTSTRAKANAAAAALALIAAECGEEAVPQAVNVNLPWQQIEASLSTVHRMLWRSAYMRAVTLNGGIRDRATITSLTLSIPTLAAAAKQTQTERTLAFTLVRAVAQLLRSQQRALALNIMASALRHIPLAFAQETICAARGQRKFG